MDFLVPAGTRPHVPGKQVIHGHLTFDAPPRVSLCPFRGSPAAKLIDGQRER